jgi:hypothetical protein
MGMRDRRETIQAIANAELDKWGLTAKGWTHIFEDAGPKEWLGQSRDRPCNIVSNSHYVDNGLSMEQIVDTIRHEIAHALDTRPSRYSRDGKRLCHDGIWRRWAMIVGANPRACAVMDGYVIPAHLVKKTKWAMVLIENDGGLEFIRSCTKFMEMAGRGLRSRKGTRNKLYLVLTIEWEKYMAGKIRIDNLEFWQDNPNPRDDWFGRPAIPKKIGVKV